MQHKRSRLRLAQKPDHARLLQRNLVTSLVLYESIRTTRKRAKVIQPLFDKLITTAKTKDGHVRIRAIANLVADVNAGKKVVEVLVPRFSKRPSGYTKMIPVGSRKGDGAQLVDLMILDREEPVAAAPAAEKKPKAAKAPKAKKTETASSSQS